MITLTGKTHYLHLFTRGRKRGVEILIDNGRRHHGANPYYRVSPIFPTQGGAGSVSPPILLKGRWELLLYGPVRPGSMGERPNAKTGYWVSFGLLNNMLVTRDRTLVKRLANRCTEGAIAYEWLPVINGEVDEAQARDFFPAISVSGGGVADDTLAAAGEISHTKFELTVALQTLHARVVAVRPAMREALDGYIRQINGIAKISAKRRAVRTELVDRLRLGAPQQKSARLLSPTEQRATSYYDLYGELQKINSGLARLAAQSGTSIPPLFEHECHYWAHSALGIATGTFGLVNFCEHIHSTVGQRRIARRFGALFSAPFPSKLPRDEWDTFEVDIQQFTPIEAATTAEVGPEGQDFLPPRLSLPFFSGRDGFQSNGYSVSAPLGSLTAATSLRWSPCNLTHELSHDIIRAILGRYLVPKLKEANQRQQILEEFLDTTSYQTIGAYVRSRFLRLAVFFSEEVALNGQRGQESAFRGRGRDQLHVVERVLRKHLIDIEEVLVHSFDFLYFYSGNPMRYLQSIWSSWATIPEVDRRIERYLVRSMCAVSLTLEAKNEPKYVAELTVKALRSLDRQTRDSECVQLALLLLTHDKELLLSKVAQRKDMAELVRRFMYSQSYRGPLHQETASGNRLRALEFSGLSYSNPLDLVTRFCRQARLSMPESVWLYNTLAYCQKGGAICDAGA